MKHLNIHCTHCDSQTVIKNGKIKMTCMCDDEIRMIDLNEHIDGRHNHSVYSMFNDDYEYVNVK
jgi:endogenous inhibitor of DNA gyrase (YacG/DUF329 family)